MAKRENGSTVIVPKRAGSELPVLPSQPPPPCLAVEIEARSVSLRWLNEPKDFKTKYAKCHYKVTRADLQKLLFAVVYEGEDCFCVIDGLKPSTNYRFVVSYIPFENNSGDVLAETSQIDIRTMDDSATAKAAQQLLRHIIGMEHEKADALIAEHKGRLSMETRDKFGRTLLMVAASEGSVESAKVLLKNGAIMNAQTPSGKTPLTMAISEGQFGIVELLLEKDPKLAEHVDAAQITTLMWAAQAANESAKKGHGSKIISRILQATKDINRTDLNGNTALDYLCMVNGNVDAARVLLHAGARLIYQVDKKHSTTTLMTAAMNGFTELCEELILNWNCDPSAVSLHGYRAEEFATNANFKQTAAAIKELRESRLKS